MASTLRCTNIITGRLTTIQRQLLQSNNGHRVLSVVPKHNYHDQRHWDRFNNYKSQFSSNVPQLISIGCATVLIYNWRRLVYPLDLKPKSKNCFIHEFFFIDFYTNR